MPVKRILLKHFLHLKSAVNTVGARALVDVDNFFAQVRRDDVALNLYPQFITYDGESKGYTFKYAPDVVGFCGWRPYPRKSPEIFTNKLKLKKALAKRDIQMPAHSKKNDCLLENVIIKRQVSSFGSTISGPFRSCNGKSLNGEIGEYFEQFIRGDIVKIWFWDDKPVSYERHKMPTVVGDGKSTILDLVKNSVAANHYQRTLETIHDVLLYEQKQMDTILAEGESILIDFRYGSKLVPVKAIQDFQVDSKEDNPLNEQLHALGNVLWKLLPQKIRQGTVYTVDAIVDDMQQLWFLEANSNPIVHPYVYQPMISSYFSDDPASETVK